MCSVFMKSECFLNKLKYYKNIIQTAGIKTYSSVVYVQGQSPEKKIREYFYYIDHQGMVGTLIRDQTISYCKLINKY